MQNHFSLQVFIIVAWSLSFTAITQFSGIASNAYAIGVSIANVIMLVGFKMPVMAIIFR